MEITPHFDWFTMISLVINLIFGGGLLVTLVTLKAQKQQAEATAKSTEVQAEGNEIDNVDKVAKMWREYAEASEQRYQLTIDKMSTEMSAMHQRMADMEGTIKKLTTTNNQILKIVRDINHENLDQKKQEAADVART